MIQQTNLVASQSSSDRTKVIDRDSQDVIALESQEISSEIPSDIIQNHLETSGILTLDHLDDSIDDRNGKTVHRSVSHPVMSTRPVDPAALYRNIRDSLDPSSFQEFANTVAAFNTGKSSASQTVDCIKRILGSGSLCDQMTRLILEAVS